MIVVKIEYKNKTFTNLPISSPKLHEKKIESVEG